MFYFCLGFFPGFLVILKNTLCGTLAETFFFWKSYIRVGASENSREKISLNAGGKKEPGNYSTNLALVIFKFSSLIYYMFGQVTLGQLL